MHTRTKLNSYTNKLINSNTDTKNNEHCSHNNHGHHVFESRNSNQSINFT